MNAQTHNLTQGSDEWHAFRAKHFGASEAAAMLGISPYESRDELLRKKATGIAPEVDDATQRLFDIGHAVEAAVRPVVESVIGEDLFHPTMSLDIDGLPLSCSCDGLTMMQDIVWECKKINNTLRQSLADKTLPESYHPQLEQLMLITGATSALFTAGEEDGNYLEYRYESNPELRKQILAGWKQFAEDLKEWKPVEVVAAAPAVEAIEQLPALSIQIVGGVTRSNLDAYKATALKFIAAINTDLQTDQDFAAADAMVRFFGSAEKELDAVKQAALNQTADIADLFHTIDTLKSEMRTRRLELDKLVKSRKQRIKEFIVHDANAVFAAHISGLENRLSHIVRMPEVQVNFIGAIKNKRTVESLRNAVNTELARCKIAANELADRIDTNVKSMLDHAPEHRFLFTDLQQTCTKATDDFTNMVKLRVAGFKAEEQRKMEVERERIRKEEEEKARRKIDEERRKLEEEQRKRRDAEQAAAKGEQERLETEAARLRASEYAKAAQEAAERAEEGRKQRELEAAQQHTTRGMPATARWTYEVKAKGSVPMKYITIDSEIVNAAIRNGERDIPGLRIYQESSNGCAMTALR